jgi:RNA polymerase sigma factor (sigma-70 family)
VRAFCTEVGLCQSDVGRYLNLKQSPWNKKTGELKTGAARIVEATGRNALWLFDPDLYEQDFLPRGTLIAEIEPHLMLSGANELRDVAALGPAPDEVLMAEEELSVSDLLHNTLHTLTPREEDIIKRRFALDPYGRAQTYEAIGEFYDVTSERIRQIEGKTLRKLRHPLRGAPLRRAMRGEDPFPPRIEPDAPDKMAHHPANPDAVRRVAKRARIDAA